ncbi:MAG TPA: hypothetical protein VMT14_02215 [Burkholderiaceae bacterium]|jgi:hypothetical protein|nr:hypothetical protein [Burkholderiaceae bacterium]
MMACPHCGQAAVSLLRASSKALRIACRACGGHAAVGWLCLAFASLPMVVAACASLLAPNVMSAALCWIVGIASSSALIYGFAPLVKR